MGDTRVFVGNLPMDVREREVEDLFFKYGRIRSVDLKVGLDAHNSESCPGWAYGMTYRLHKHVFMHCMNAFG